MSTPLLNRVRIEPVTTKEDLHALVLEGARLEFERDKTVIERDEKKAEIAEPYDVQIEAYEAELEAITNRLHAYSNQNRKAEFGDKKSKLIAGHKLAYRESPGQVEYQPGVKAADALKSILATPDEKDVIRFTTVKAAIAKNPIIAAWDKGPEQQTLIRSFGIEVIKPELFSFTPNRDEVPDIAVKATK